MVFLFIFLIIILLILAIMTIKIKFKILNFKFDSNTNEHINQNFKLQIILKIFANIPILKISITKQKIDKVIKNEKIKEKLKEQEIKAFENKEEIKKQIFSAMKNIKIDIREMDLKINIGTENAAVTALIVPVLSTIIAIFCSNKIKKINNMQKFEIQPVYINKNLINILVSGIFEIRMIHIINTICTMKKEGKGDKNERTSNRRTYDYSYE